MLKIYCQEQIQIVRIVEEIEWCRLLSSLKLTGAYYVKIKMRASSDINYQRLQFK